MKHSKTGISQTVLRRISKKAGGIPPACRSHVSAESMITHFPAFPPSAPSSCHSPKQTFPRFRPELFPLVISPTSAFSPFTSVHLTHNSASVALMSPDLNVRSQCPQASPPTDLTVSLSIPGPGPFPLPGFPLPDLPSLYPYPPRHFKWLPRFIFLPLSALPQTSC